MSARRVLAMMRKEVIQIRRDPRSLLIIVLIPIVQLLMYGYAVNLDARHVPVCLFDRDGSEASRELLAHFRATDYFDVAAAVDRYPDVVHDIDAGRCTVGIVVPPRFSESLHATGGATVQALVDASDANTAGLGIAYAQAIVQSFAHDVSIAVDAHRGTAPRPATVSFEARTWFNEDLESMANIVPGVIALVMAVVGSFLTSMTIAREWERGTMEQLVSTPIGRLEIQIGKLVPYFVIGLADTALCAGMAVWWFDVPFRGSWLVLVGCSTLFLVAVLSLGYYISVTAKSQLGAGQMAMLATFLPTFLLSGVIFPIDQMPVVVQWITRLVPGRYYVAILRDVFLKGTAVSLLLPPLAALGAIAAVLTVLSTRAFQKRIE